MRVRERGMGNEGGGGVEGPGVGAMDGASCPCVANERKEGSQGGGVSTRCFNFLAGSLSYDCWKLLQVIGTCCPVSPHISKYDPKKTQGWLGS
jgi:hypothetical protein